MAEALVEKISIVIPTLNEEKYLPLLLDSIRRQDYPNYEVIVSDAGSKDGTLAIARAFGCTVVTGGPVSVGRNRGADAATGDILLFLDADLILPHEQFLTNTVSQMHARKLDIAGFPVSPIGGKLIDRFALWCWNTLARLTQNIMPHAAAAILARKNVHRHIEGFDEAVVLAEDHHYVREGGKHFTFGFIHQEPVFFSTRRYAKDGSLKTHLKYVLAGLYIIFVGPIKSDIFKYRFNHHQEDKNTR